MLRSAAADFGAGMLGEAARRFGLEAENLVMLEGFENRVYEAPEAGLVLRIGHSSHRTADQVAAELAWIDHLADGGARVARPVAVPGASPVEIIPTTDGRYFVAAAFTRAPGVILDDDPDAKERYWNGRLFRRWGREAGRLHRIAAGYSPPGIARPEWHEIDDLASFDAFVPDPDLRRAARAHIDKLRSMPRSRRDYGLVHADLTQWNFVVDGNGEITVFDFDSTMRCWFAMDLAVALYYARSSDRAGTGRQFAGDFLRRFVEGYRREHSIDEQALGMLPDLLVLQTIILCSIAHQDRPGTDREAIESFREKAKRRLLDGEPVIDADFATLARDIGGAAGRTSES